MRTTTSSGTALGSVVASLLFSRGESFGFDNAFTRTNQGSPGSNVTLPRNRAEAESLGWVQSVRDDGSPCRPGLGFEYTEGASVHTQERPLSLFFDAGADSGLLTALSLRAWFQNTSSYNPDSWPAPAFGASDSTERWLTVNTRDPAMACEAGTRAAADEDALGDRLTFNNAGARVAIPLEEPEDPDGAWKSGACDSNMGRHWGFPLDADPASGGLLGYDHGVHVLPVNPMYSVVDGPGLGQITALAFFTTEPQVTQKSGGVWDASGTPAQLCAGNYCVDSTECVFGASNSVFHVFFIDQWSAPAQCPNGSPDCPAASRQFN